MNKPTNTQPRRSRPRAMTAQGKLFLACFQSVVLLGMLTGGYLHFSSRPAKRIEKPAGKTETTGAPSEAAVAPVPAQGTQAPRSAERMGLGYRPGDLLTCRFAEQRSLLIADVPLPGEGMASAGPRTASLEMGTAGKLLIKVYEQSDRGWTLGFEARDVKVTVHGANAALERKDLAEAMTGEVLVVMAPNGAMGTILFPPGMTAEARNQWRDRLARLELVLPEDAGAQEWTASQEDTTGKYTAAYSRKAVEGKSVITRSKVEYSALGPEGDAGLAASLFSSGETVIVLEPPIVSVTGREAMRFAPQGARQETEAEVRFALERESLVASPAVLAAARSRRLLLESLRGTTLGAAERGESLALDAEFKDLGTPGEELAALRAAVLSQGASGDETHTRMQRIIALLKKDAAAVEAVLDVLRSEDASELAGVLFGALGAAGTGAAQRGLKEVFAGEDWKPQHREEALYALAQIQEPIAELDDALFGLHQGSSALSSSALLLLAAMGERVTQTDPLRRARIEEYVREQAARTDLDTDQRIAALGALENLAPDQTPPEVRRAAVDAEDLVRVAAVEALSKTPDPAADEILLRAVRHDPSEEVRLHAARVIGESDRPGGDDVLQQILLNDGSDRVRMQALQALAEKARADGAVRSLVAAVAERDESSEIQDAAREILNGGSRSSEPAGIDG